MKSTKSLGICWIPADKLKQRQKQRYLVPGGMDSVKKNSIWFTSFRMRFFRNFWQKKWWFHCDSTGWSIPVFPSYDELVGKRDPPLQVLLKWTAWWPDWFCIITVKRFIFFFTNYDVAWFSTFIVIASNLFFPKRCLRIFGIYIYMVFWMSPNLSESGWSLGLQLFLPAQNEKSPITLSRTTTSKLHRMVSKEAPCEFEINYSVTFTPKEDVCVCSFYMCNPTCLSLGYFGPNCSDFNFVFSRYQTPRNSPITHRDLKISQNKQVGSLSKTL